MELPGRVPFVKNPTRVALAFFLRCDTRRAVRIAAAVTTLPDAASAAPRLRRQPATWAFRAVFFGIAIHSFAHALMRELALECGYNAASLRERIYAKDDDGDGPAMAGVLIYTAAPDSEGTLGGLVRMGRPEYLEQHIGRALERLTLCSSDPLCADHTAEKDGATLHGACCHACLFAPETSCERGNRYLDRTLLVETVKRAHIGWFEN